MSELHLERCRAMEFPDDNQKAVALVLAHFARPDGEIPQRIYDGLDDGRVWLSLRRCACGALTRVEARSLGLTIATVDAGHRCAKPAPVSNAGGAP